MSDFYLLASENYLPDKRKMENSLVSADGKLKS
jgi:hypothetical protein